MRFKAQESLALTDPNLWQVIASHHSPGFISLAIEEPGVTAEFSFNFLPIE